MRKERIFFVINEACEALSLSNRPRQVLNLILGVISKSLGADAAWAFLGVAGKQEDMLTITTGLNGAQVRELKSPGLRHVLEDRTVTGDPVVVADLAGDKGFGVPDLVKAGFGSMAVVPLATGQSEGMLGALWRSEKCFDADSGYIMMVIGNMVCAALERAALYERLLGGVEVEPGIKYDIEEFEKLVALAEQYSRATRLAISEAVVRAKGSGGAAPQSAAAGPGTQMQELSGNGEGKPVAEGTPACSEKTSEAAPEKTALERHQQRMLAFARHHPVSIKWP